MIKKNQNSNNIYVKIIEGGKTFLAGLITALLIFNGMPMQAQDCVDIEQIKNDLSNISDQCSCSSPLDLGVTGQTTDISTYQLGVRVQNECIRVYGTLVIDQGISFEDCDFIFDDGALIKLDDEIMPVSFSGCNLQSCGDYFWDGIDIGTENQFYFRANTMQHAFNGIHTSTGPTFSYVTDNVFNDNRYAIDIEGIGPLFTMRSGLTLTGNIFAQTNDLKTHWSDPDWSHEKSYGVRTNITIVNSLVGDDPCDRTNVFIGLNEGYYLRNSISQIDADLFYDFKSSQSLGISATTTNTSWFGSSSLIQSGWPTNDIETFDNVLFSILTENTTTDIRGNIIRNSNWGIFTNGSPMLENIKNNDIQVNLGPGIFVYNSGVASEIEKNIIQLNHDSPYSLDQASAVGIKVFGLKEGVPLRSQSSSSSGTIIRDNGIQLNPGYAGISTYGEGVYLYNISCNSINIEETLYDYAAGIEVYQGYQNLLEENTINGQYLSTSANEINGLKIVESQENTLRSNYISNTQIGFHFSNWNNHTRQEKNSFKNHDVGYYVGESGVTGDQYFSANQWRGSYGDWGALNDGDPHKSRYNDYQNFQSTSCWPGSISPDPGWFVPRPGIGNCSGNSSTACTIEAEPELEHLTFLDTIVARGELIFGDFDNERIWQAERYLIRNLTEFPYLVGPSGSLMDSFLTEVQTTVLWDYHQLRSEIDEYAIIPDSISDDCLDRYAQYQVLMNNAEIAIENWLVYPDSFELTEPISVIYEEIDSIWTKSSEAYQNWRSDYVANLENLLPDVLALNTPNAYAASEKVIMEAKIKLAQGKDSVSNSLRNTLIQLAESCLLENGPAVIDATVILHRLDLDPAMFKLNCNDTGGERSVEPTGRTYSFEVFPNPTSGNFTLKFNSDPKEEGVLEIYDSNGKLMQTSKVESTFRSQEFSIDHLPSGQYIIKVNFNGIGDSRSLIISR